MLNIYLFLFIIEPRSIHLHGLVKRLLVTQHISEIMRQNSKKRADDHRGLIMGTNDDWQIASGISK